MMTTMTSTSQRTFAARLCRLSAVLLCLALAGGCGLKGDLYLDDRAAPEGSAPALPDVDDQDSTREAGEEDSDGPADAVQGG